LISKHLFQEVQDILDGRFSARPEKHNFLFRKLVKCKTCGYSLAGELQKGHIYYRCHTRTCPITSIREEVIEAAVEENLQKLTFTEAEKRYCKGAIERLKADWIEERERLLTQTNVRLQQVSDRIKRLTDAYIDQAIEKGLFEERKASL